MSKNIKRELTEGNLDNPKRLKIDNEKRVDMSSSLQKLTSSNCFPLPNNVKSMTLLLPKSYINLIEQFTSLDCVVNKIISKNLQITFMAINKVLNQMNKPDIEMEVFGQILFVFPESYHYMFAKSRYDVDVLNIMPNLSFGNDSSPRKTSKSLTLSQLILRRNTLRERLIDLVKAEHDDFLINVKKIKIETVKSMKIIRWSSDFNLATVSAIPSISFDKTIKFNAANKTSVCKALFKNSSQNIDPVKPVIIQEDINTECKVMTKVSTSYTSKITPSKILFGAGSEDITKCDQVRRVHELQSPEKEKVRVVHKVQSPEKEKVRRVHELQSPEKEKIRRVHELQSPEKEKVRVVHKVQSPENEKLGVVTKVLSPKKDHINLMKQKLPFHLKMLFELFVCFDKAVHSLYTQRSVVYLSSILKIVSYVKTYNESHFGQLLTIYPDAYKLRWENVMDKYTSKVSKKLDIVISPQLRQDGTMSALSSPTKGYLLFDCVRLKERSEKFMNNCNDIVHNSYKKYIQEQLSLNDDEVSSNLSKTVKESNFNVDVHVEMVKATSMPEKPVLVDSIKIVSIKQLFNTIKERNASEMKNVVKTNIDSVNSKLGSMSQSLLDRIKQNKEKRGLFARNDTDVKRKLILSQLPSFVRAMLVEFNKQLEKKPIGKNDMMKVVCKGCSISEDSFDDYIAALNEVAPNFIHVLNWDPPSFKLGSSHLSIVELEKKLSSLLQVK